MRNTIFRLIVLAVFFSLSLLHGFGQSKRGFLPTDLSLLKEVSDAQISPDGSKIVFTVSETLADRARSVSHLWIVPAPGGEPKRLTTNDATESTPRWSPDGRWIAFYSNRDNRDGLWMVPAEGGAPQPLIRVYRTNFFLNKAGESFCWAPDGKSIAFLSSIEVLGETPAIAAADKDRAPAGVPAAALRPLSREEIDKLPIEVREMLFRAQGQAMGLRPQSPIENALSPIPDDPRVITRLQYKSRTSFSDNLQSHIFVYDLASRQVRQITTGLAYEHSLSWSPKGDEIAFVSNREPDPDKINNTDLFTVNVKTFALRQLTKTKGCEWQPVFSPDGASIAYLATKRELTTIDSVAEDTHAFVLPAAGGEAKETNLDRRTTAIKWTGNSLLLLYGDSGKSILKQEGSAKELSNRNAQITGFSVARNGAVAFVASDETHPAEVFSATPEVAQVTAFNQVIGDSIHARGYREFKFDNDGVAVQGWLVPPMDLDEKKKYPLVLLIHGGPHGMHGYGFNSGAQAMAAHGYAVLMINPRGSSGYGQKFADGCVGDWGGGDYRDLMKGVDEALAKWPFLDKDRLAVTGGSYGGYMTNWAVTQTNRFKAAVTLASLSNLISFYSTSLYQDLVHAEFNGFPWNNYELLWERSPLKHIAKAETPLLLLHGEQDNDVHITQAEEMFTALKMRGIDTVFVRYPREGHGFREPRHREDSLARTLQWFDRYLKK
jgi:dipeptidyl aminopeptidase/acylaminoacyl peptidase